AQKLRKLLGLLWPPPVLEQLRNQAPVESGAHVLAAILVVVGDEVDILCHHSLSKLSTGRSSAVMRPMKLTSTLARLRAVADLSLAMNSWIRAWWPANGPSARRTWSPTLKPFGVALVRSNTPYASALRVASTQAVGTRLGMSPLPSRDTTPSTRSIACHPGRSRSNATNTYPGMSGRITGSTLRPRR